MAATYSIEIKTPKEAVFEGPIESLVAPATDGYVGILANHAPFITMLKPGSISCRDSSGLTKKFKSTGNGLLEVLNNNAIILLDSVEAGP